MPRFCCRIGGEDRYETCLMINDRFLDLFDGVELTVATGLNYPDALVGGVYSAFYRAPLLLVNNKKLSDGQKDFINYYHPTFVTAFGGETVVSDAMLGLIAQAVK